MVGAPLTDADLPEIVLRGLTADSREVEPGYLFAALPGTKVDGRRFIADAEKRGAVAILGPPGTTANIPVLIDERPRRRLAKLAAAFYGLQPRALVAVTGTNGKTSTAEFARQIWRAAGFESASLGTLGLRTNDIADGGGLTTPDPVALQRTLTRLALAGIDHVALEASSHGLAQYRLDGTCIRAAAFTSFSRDHLDYHASEADYLTAKLRLFTEVMPAGGVAVVHSEEAVAGEVMAAAEKAGHQLVRYGRDGDLRISQLQPQTDGLLADLVLFGRPEQVYLPLTGDFQVLNVLAAAGLATAAGTDPAAIVRALPDLRPVRGRLELAGRPTDGKAAVYVDYAHTPDALRVALTALRPHAHGRLVVVFGCGGDRDRGKRPEMGRAAATHADIVIVTDDNPRSEDPAAIRREALVGAPHAQEIGDRREAIAHALSLLGAGDLLLVAGKGHEQGQIVGDRRLPFDDVAVVRELLGTTRA